jgi:phospholipid transport system substrate-binding protein
MGISRRARPPERDPGGRRAGHPQVGGVAAGGTNRRRMRMAWREIVVRLGLRVLPTLVLIAAPLASASGEDAATAEASRVVQQSLDRGMAVLRDDTLPLEQKREQVEAIVYQHFDFDRMARLVLARNWRKLSAEEQSQFLVEFKRHMSATYGRRLENISDEQIEIVGARKESNGDVTVKSIATGGAAGAGAKIDYRLRTRQGQWLVIDVIVEGVSLIHNFRSQVQEIISAKGPQGLIVVLREKNDRAESAENS